jgi:hypothetical protein
MMAGNLSIEQRKWILKEYWKTVYLILAHPVYMCCAFVGLGNKLYKKYGTYSKI